MTTVAVGSRMRSVVPLARLASLASAVATGVAAGALDPRLAALLLLGLGTLIATLWAPDLGVAIVAATVPLQDVVTVTIGVATVTPTKTAIVALLAGWTVRRLLDRTRARLDFVALALGAYVIVLMISGLNARDLGAWAGEVYRWAIAATVYVLALTAYARGRGVALTLGMMSVAVIGVAVIAAAQAVGGGGPRSFEVGGATRAYGLFGEPNPLAGYLEMTVPLLAAVAAGSWSRRSTASRGPAPPPMWRPIFVLTASAAALGGVAVVLTQSRGGALGLAAGWIAVVWLTGGRVRRVGAVATAGAIVALLVTPTGGRLVDRFDVAGVRNGGEQVTSANFAERERSAHWGAAIAMARAHPLLGVGAGNFDRRYREFTPEWRFRIPRGHAHNGYLQAAAQAGLLGLVAYLGVLGAAWLLLARRLRRVSDPLRRSVVVGAIGVLTAVSVHQLVEYLHVLSLGIQLSIVLALALAPSERETPAGGGWSRA